MNKKIVAFAIVPVLGLALVGARGVSAHGMGGGFGFGFSSSLSADEMATRQQTQFQKEAELLGVSVDDVKNGWSQGKNLGDIAKDHNITQDQLKQKMQDAATAQTKAQFQTFVTKGILTQAQVDARLKFMQDRQVNAKGRMGGMMGRGSGHRGRGGFGGFGF